MIKAKSYFDLLQFPTLADDSGLEVEILENRPGILSARYGGDIPQREKNKLLVEEVY